MAISVTSTAFAEGGMIPKRYSCLGENLSPPLTWSRIPEKAKFLAIIVDDPDAAKVWVHWVLYNLPASVDRLPEGVPTTETLASGAHQGLNDSRKVGYSGPCPPSGTHRYRFNVYALDTPLSPASGMTKARLLEAMDGHIVGQGQLTGKFTRE